jgi:tyrosyl-tRNA synthetase
MNFVDELRWRGMVHTMMPGTEELLEKEMVTAYLGIDPTADSLHIGHLCGVMMLRHFQRCGHKPLALVGGATGMIGDPSGKSQERNLLDEETLRHNQECIKKQLGKFLDFESDAPNRAELVNNYDWMKDFSFLKACICKSKGVSHTLSSPASPSATTRESLWIVCTSQSICD